ncbi:Disease resistance protein RPM1, partial [Mucuna pruriens]
MLHSPQSKKESYTKMAEASAVSLARQHVLPKFLEAVNMLRDLPKEVAYITDELESFQDIIHKADEVVEAEEDKDRRERMKRRVMRLREAAFRMEDVIDEYMICEEKQHDDPRCAALLCEVVDYIKTLIPRLQIAYKIRDLKPLARAERDGFQSQFPLEQRPNSSRGNQDVKWNNLRMAPLYTEEAKVVGFDDPRDKLKDWLIKGRVERSVISVVGMAGLGKTTLAKQVFDDKEVIANFDCHACITVSQLYDVEKLLRDMLRKFCKEQREDPPHDVSNMDRMSLIDEVRNHLRHKRYVVLFDDVWNDKFWDDVEFAIVDDKNSSRILITTRYEKVAEFCKKSSFVQVHELKPLIEEKSLELFYKRAFQYGFNGCCPKELVAISLEIVRKCKGLPLAIVAIAGVLSRKSKSVPEWKLFSQNLSLELERNSELNNITKILGLSYDDLPYNLRECLLYFGMYPEDYEVKSNRLIRQWIAEGFVKPERGKALEEVAKQYLTELIHRNLVQVTSFTIDGKVKGCRVHDLLHEMILRKSKDTGFCQYIGDNGEHDQSVSSGIVRRLTIATDSNALIRSTESSHIRSILIITDKELSEQLVRRIPTKCMLLKVLHFEDALIYYVPENLGNLIHLKYLSFRNTWLKCLPKSIGKLQNLETLDVRQTHVSELPKEICKLKKLHHLLADEISSSLLKDCLGGMTSLQRLRLLNIDDDDDGVVIRELGKLKQLRELRMCKLRREHGNTLCSSINEMQLLEVLWIDTEVINLQFVSPMSTLGKLYLSGKLEGLPNWIPQLQNLVKLFFVWSKLTNDPLESLKDMPSLALLSFKLYAYEGETLHFQSGGFQQLKTLQLENMENLNSIFIDNGALSSLENLDLTVIPKLKTLPSGFQHLEKLKVLNILHMPLELEENIATNGGKEHWIVQNVPGLRIFSEMQIFDECCKSKIGLKIWPPVLIFMMEIDVQKLKHLEFKIPSAIQHLEKLQVLNILSMPIEFQNTIAVNAGQAHWKGPSTTILTSSNFFYSSQIILSVTYAKMKN